MTSPTVDSPFDPAAATAQLAGTWSYPLPAKPSGFGYIHYTADGVIFLLVYDSGMPDRRIPVRHAFSLESATIMRILPTLGSTESSIVHYEIDGDTHTLINPESTHICARVSPEEIPTWFREALTKYL